VLDQSVPGSGDAFAAGFLLALAAGHSLAACVERGHEAATGA
jgi:sugar/nucleoside kinase (ribokinase family)